MNTSVEKIKLEKDDIYKVITNNKTYYTKKIIIGSPSIKEGISLLRVRNVHILDPYWNWSRMNQIIGRAVRFCSHKDVPLKDRKVNVYIYIAYGPNGEKTIDNYILELANIKNEITN